MCINNVDKFLNIQTIINELKAKYNKFRKKDIRKGKKCKIKKRLLIIFEQNEDALFGSKIQIINVN